MLQGVVNYLANLMAHLYKSWMNFNTVVNESVYAHFYVEE